MVREIRERFPLNSMVPLIKRTEGKPSERVRLRRLVKQMQEEGFSISSYSHHLSKADLQLQENYEQSGTAIRLVVRHREGDYTSPRSVEMFRELQEKMHEISLPMIGYGDGMHLQECTEESLPWYESGIGGFWQGFSLEESLAWRRAGIIELWRARGWRDYNYLPQDAALWRSAGLYSADEAEKWKSRLDEVGVTATPELVAQFTDARISPDQAASARTIWQQHDTDSKEV